MPDLILMDLSLPGMDGWEATRILKKDPATRTSSSSPSALTRWRRKAIARGWPAAMASSRSPACHTDLVEEMLAYLKVQPEPSSASRQRRPRTRRS